MKERFEQVEQEAVEVTTSQQLIGFVIGEELFGVDILAVQEIISDTTITGIPDAPDFLEGVINLRGRIVPVIDLRKRLKLVAPDQLNPDPWIVILTVEGRVTGFLVDRVTMVLNVAKDSIKPPPAIVVAGLKSQYIQGVCYMDQRLLILLNFS